MIGTLVKIIICWIQARVIASVIKYVKLMNIWILTIVFWEKLLIGKLALECEDEMLNTTEILHNDKKLEFVKSSCLIHTISLIVICSLLLVVICVSCYFYYTKYQSKQPFHDIKIKLGEIRYSKYIIKRESNYELKKMILNIAQDFSFNIILVDE